MLAKEFIIERKKKRKKSRTKTRLSRYFYPGFGYYGYGSSDSSAGDSGGMSGGDGGGGSESMYESKEVIASEVEKFKDWASKKLHIKNPPKIDLSYDSEQAQKGHHTGMHVPNSGVVWVYAKNRNLVDILRTVFHELVHVRQEELNMIEPGSSYPGSPIEAMADMLAGKYIKIYGKQNRNIFQ
jgi:hypothetical protein